jgi:hypothetical protein
MHSSLFLALSSSIVVVEEEEVGGGGGGGGAQLPLHLPGGWWSSGSPFL